MVDVDVESVGHYHRLGLFTDLVYVRPAQAFILKAINKYM